MTPVTTYKFMIKCDNCDSIYPLTLHLKQCYNCGWLFWVSQLEKYYQIHKMLKGKKVKL